MTRAVAIVVLLAVLVGCTSGGGGGGGDPLARLAVIDESVSVQPNAEDGFGSAQSGRALGLGDTIRTGEQGRAQVDYAEGSLTRLDRNTTLVVEKLAAAARPTPIGVRIDVGRTWNEVADVTGSGERFEAGTSNSVATVRGTVFTVDATPDQVSTFMVAEGTVEVVTRTGERITLQAGDRVTVLPDGSLGPLVRVNFDDLSSADEWIRFNLGLRRAPGPTTPGAATTTSRPSTTINPTTPTVPGSGSATTTRPGLAPPTTGFVPPPTTVAQGPPDDRCNPPAGPLSGAVWALSQQVDAVTGVDLAAAARLLCNLGL